MAKTWAEKLAGGSAPHVETLTKPYVGMQPGQRLFIPDPQLVNAAFKKVKRGHSLTLRDLRAKLAHENEADGTCPLVMGIFARIVAEAAWDELQAGTSIEAITPFWRVIEPGSAVAKRLRCGDGFIEAQRAVEGIPK
jgi:hypothetical protein